MSEKEYAEIYIKYGDMFDNDYYPNEPAGELSEEEIIKLYKKCIETGKPWQHYIKHKETPGAIY